MKPLGWLGIAIWSLLLVFSLLFVIASVLSAKHEINAPQTYTGRTTLMERPAESRGVAVYNYGLAAQQNIEQHVADLATIAMSTTVRQRALEEMATLNIAEDADTLEKSLKIEPVPGTQLLAISVTLPLSEERMGDAAVAASIVSQEFKRFYQTLVGGAAEQSRRFIESEYIRARASFISANRALSRAGSGPERELARMDVRAAADTYSLLRAKLDEARIKENEATKTSPAIVTIDEPQTFRDERNIPRKLGTAAGVCVLSSLIFLLSVWRLASSRRIGRDLRRAKAEPAGAE